MRLPRLCAVTLSALLAACGPKRPQNNGQSQEELKAGKVAGAALSVGVTLDDSLGLAFLLSRLETTTQTPPIKIPEGETLYFLESDPAFELLRPLLKDYPSKQPYLLYGAEGSQQATVSGVALTRAGCDERWAAYPLLAAQQPITKSEVVLARPGEGASGLTSLRLLAPSDSVPEAVRAILDGLPLLGAGSEKRLWARLLELDGDSGAELFVARATLEPLADHGARAAAVEGLWLDESSGSWRLIEQSARRIAQEDLLRFSGGEGWEQWASPPVLVVDIEGDSIAEVVRSAADGYSLWRFEAGEATRVSQWVLAAKERCE